MKMGEDEGSWRCRPLGNGMKGNGIWTVEAQQLPLSSRVGGGGGGAGGGGGGGGGGRRVGGGGDGWVGQEAVGRESGGGEVGGKWGKKRGWLGGGG